MVDAASLKRRQFLSGLMKLLVFIGFIFISIPFISSFSSNELNEKQASTSRWVVSFPISDLEAGTVTALPWAGGLYWVYARTEKEIQALALPNNLLRDEHSERSDQPEGMKNNYRSANNQFFVFVPHENKKGCQVRLSHEIERELFTEPCFSAKYDSAGRLFKNSGDKEQKNLAVPKHAIEDGILKIGIWTPKV